MKRAIVLRLLRADARAWWWFKELRKRGRHEEATTLERAAVRSSLANLTETGPIECIYFGTGCVQFHRPPNPQDHPWGYTVSVSNAAHGLMAAFIYCYAQRIRNVGNAERVKYSRYGGE